MCKFYYIYTILMEQYIANYNVQMRVDTVYTS